MLRRAALVLCLCAFSLSLGCGGSTPPSNPGNLEYGKDPPPKRGGPPGEKTK
jgi:hypothetical protein